MNYKCHILIVFLALQICACSSQQQVVTSDMETATNEYFFDLNLASLFRTTLEKTRAEVDAEILNGIEVPLPKDMAGGYTHERHKKNWFILQKAGDIFHITKEEKYADYIKSSLMKYAELYPTLPIHPTDRSYATGKLFWQCLNDANWLVYCSQAYSSIYNWLSTEDRTYLESQLFRPMADFLSVENPQFFNRIHNHSTWANAAVGMIGLVMDDEELIERALYGLKNDQLDASMVDNDGGYLVEEGQRKAGFLAQLDYSFSPDGHFTEGPYYLRYAMTPFLLFGRALDQYKPELEIYNYRDRILEKAVYALLEQTDAQGRFFPINDAQKGMSWINGAVMATIDIAYNAFGNDPMLLSIAQLQNRVILDEAGYEVSKAIDMGLAQPFKHSPIMYKDGANGDIGGLAIVRSDNEQGEELCFLFKYAAHGMGHGHFDRLSYSLYDEEDEVIQDYGSARWVNIDQKGGGRYLKENQTFAKQTVAHNTIVVNQKSQNNGKVKLAETNKSHLFFAKLDDSSQLAVSVKDSSVYPGVDLHRSLLLLSDDGFEFPLLIDLFKVSSDQKNMYELPTWFKGHHLSTNWNYNRSEYDRKLLGNEHGYQHIWIEAVSESLQDVSQFTWFDKDRFFTMSSITSEDDEIIFARLGANDPEFNLRPDPAHILRRSDVDDALFVSVLEVHGFYDAVTEIPRNPFGSIESLKVLLDTNDYTAFQIKHKNGDLWDIAIANRDNDSEKEHSVAIDEEKHDWVGPLYIKKS